MCRFVMNPSSNDLQPTSSATTAAPEYLSVPEVVAQPFTTLTTFLGKVQEAGQVPLEEMCYEVRRLQSFSGVPVKASPMRLAQSGFYATGHEDEARCFSCGKSHVGWQIMDRPDVLHRVISPDCPHLKRNEPRNIPLTSNSNATTVYGVLGEYCLSSNVATTTHTSPLADTEIPTPEAATETAAAADAAPAVSGSSLDMHSAVHLHYKDMQTRLDSFRTWDISHVQDPRVLAAAGFFYAGYSDCVRCFYCGVGLKTWEERDDPLVEHVRWRSSCSYISKLKGENFVIQTLAKIGSSQPAENKTYNNNRVPSLQGSAQLSVNNTHISYQPATSQNMTVVARAVEMGFTRQMVERALVMMSQSYNNPRAAEETGQNPLRLEELIERLVITSALRDDGHRNSDISEERPQISDISEETPQMSDTPIETPQMSDIPVKTPQMSDIPVKTPQMSDIPMETPQMSDIPVKTPQMSDIPVKTPQMSDIPMETPQMSDIPMETPQMSDISEETPQMSYTPIETPQMSDISEETPQMSDTPIETPQMSDIPMETPQMSDIPMETPQMSDLPEMKPRISEVHNERQRMFEIAKHGQEGSEVSQSLPARLAPPNDSSTSRQLTSMTTPNVSYKRYPPGTETSRSMPPSLQRQLEEENRALRDETTCKVCLDRTSNIVFLPCGHLVTCAECAPALSKCPICRAHIRGTVRTYNA